MTKDELHKYLKEKYPKENEGCEWKAFHNLKNAFSSWEGNDIISYVSAISNMEGGQLVIGIEDSTLEIRGIQIFNTHTPESTPLR
ncbi:MAG: RNA-binding domain-containing protein [Bacteroidota bacterium]